MRTKRKRRRLVQVHQVSFPEGAEVEPTRGEQQVGSSRVDVDKFCNVVNAASVCHPERVPGVVFFHLMTRYRGGMAGQDRRYL